MEYINKGDRKMENKELNNKVDEILLKIAYLQNNVKMTADVFDMAKSRKSDSTENSQIKLYEFERIGNRVETTFNYIDTELEFLFNELNQCLSLIK
ncbi:hypothetical protein VBG40_02020 [Vagococcus fluvialis]|uniref:hypothetical protein n=1 Tax=Vagococcus fluvialis TaxID=2738 RepID=UPI0037B4337F